MAPAKKKPSGKKKPLRERTPRRELPSRRKYDWDAILRDYLTPIVSDDGMKASWRSLVDLAALHGVPLQTIRESSAQEGWVAQQDDARRRWNAELRLRVDETLFDQVVGLRVLAYNNSARLINLVRTKLNGEPDAATMVRMSRINRDALEVGLAVVGYQRLHEASAPPPPPTPLPVPSLNVQVNNISMNGEPAPGAPLTLTTLWASLVQARRSPPPDTLDAHDLPSPLPAHLSSAR